VKIREEREVKITPEVEPHLDTSGTHCLKCGSKTKDIESVIVQVASKKTLGGTRDAVKSKCAYGNANKNKFVTKINGVLNPIPNRNCMSDAGSMQSDAVLCSKSCDWCG